MTSKSIDGWDVHLGDEGTLDTVIICLSQKEPTIQYTERFSCDYASDFRDPNNGMLTEEGFNQLAEEAVENVEERREILKGLLSYAELVEVKETKNNDGS